ncbi:hypothetical protein JCM3766R1_003390 [Sporobolomyces carnicolor]
MPARPGARRRLCSAFVIALLSSFGERSFAASSRPDAQARAASALESDSELRRAQLGFYDPLDRGGSWLTVHSLPFPSRSRQCGTMSKQEPLNVVISADSDPTIRDFDGLLDYAYSIGFSPQCFNWYDSGSQQAANLGDGNEIVNQTTILRSNYDDPILGTCAQSLQGGNHFRVFRQNGSLADSGAWFLAVSREHNLGKGHMIVKNGYDLGRDEVVSLATNSDGTRSPISKALYTATVKAVQGPAYFGNLTRDDINHGIMIDGRIAVLTVSILEPGNGSKPSTTWIATISLTEFVVFIVTVVFVVLSIGLFCFIRHRHHKHRGDMFTSSWPGRDESRAGLASRGKRDEFPLLDRSE